MSLSSHTQLNDQQADAIAAACDAAAAIASYSNQEGALQLFMDAMEFEFGESQAKRIVSRAPKFSDSLSGKNKSQPIPVPQPYTAMSLVRNRATDKANKSLTKSEIASAVAAIQH